MIISWSSTGNLILFCVTHSFLHGEKNQEETSQSRERLSTLLKSHRSVVNHTSVLGLELMTY